MGFRKKLDIELSLRISSALASRLEQLALELDTTVGEIAREALDLHLSDLEAALQSKPSCDDADAISQCQSILKDVLPRVSTWKQLQKELNEYGIEYFERGGGLALRWSTDGDYICKASVAGPGYSVLIKKFKSGFPNHKHAWLADRILKSK
jgi:predicted transcriptional regulator